MRFISLFSGFGGLDMGLERAEMQCVLQVENAPYALNVLQNYWPDVPKHDDICTLGTLPDAEVLAGGFPCQDVSGAGRKKGIIHGEKSGLWREFDRLIRLRRWEYILIENVPGLLVARHGEPAALSTVLIDLASAGYDAEWQTLSSKAFGAPHTRKRLFLVAYPVCAGLEGQRTPVFHTEPPCTAIRRVRLSPSCTVRGTTELPHYRDRIIGLGNMVDTRVAEWVGTQLLAHAAAFPHTHSLEEVYA